MSRVLWWLLPGMVALALANVGAGAGGVREHRCPRLRAEVDAGRITIHEADR